MSIETPVTGNVTSSLPARIAQQIMVLTLGNDQNKRVFRIHKDRVVIGSVVSADIQVAGDGVAPIHAVIVPIYKTPEERTAACG